MCVQECLSGNAGTLKLYADTCIHRPSQQLSLHKILFPNKEHTSHKSCVADVTRAGTDVIGMKNVYRDDGRQNTLCASVVHCVLSTCVHQVVHKLYRTSNRHIVVTRFTFNS